MILDFIPVGFVVYMAIAVPVAYISCCVLAALIIRLLER